MSLDFKSDVLGFEGGDLMEKALRKLGQKVAKKIGRKAVRQAMKPIQTQIEAAAPVVSGVLKKGIVLRTNARGEGLTASVQATDKFYKPGGQPITELFYATFYEFGTQHQPARPFMRPVFDANRHAMLADLSRELKSGIDAAARASGGASGGGR